MLRHAIAPRRFFLQVPNDLLRHPRLDCPAKVLLMYVLSLPEGADEPLQASAVRARLKKSAFACAKRQLTSEGYLHEWREQGERGRWRTEQLVSNVPLTREEAERVRHGGALGGEPGAGEPAAGAPRSRAAGHSQEEQRGNTPNLPPLPAGEKAGEPGEADRPERPDGSDEPDGTAAPEAPDSGLVRRAAAVLTTVSRGEPRLQLGGRDVERLAPVGAQWLARGCSAEHLRLALTSGLPEAVRNPVGLLYDRLRRKMPPPEAAGGLEPGPEPGPDPQSRPGSVAAPVPPLAECRVCRDPLPRGAGRTVCAPCARAGPPPVPTQRGSAAVRAVMRGGLAAAFILP